MSPVVPGVGPQLAIGDKVKHTDGRSGTVLMLAERSAYVEWPGGASWAMTYSLERKRERAP